ncbi:MAG: T9SS type A sorting domain-containing protein [Ignavibacteria bacterium]|nr:T9SS type A sorting domain-containing protein [Ignavibacteria bacterium]
MKKLFTLFFILFIAALNLNAQSFIFQRTSPLMVTGDTSSMFPTVSHAKLKNTSSSPQNFKIVRILLPGFPSSWETSLCCNAGCFSSELDTIPPAALNYTLAPGETDSTIAIDLYGMVHGTGSMILKVFVQGNPAVYQIDTFKFKLQSPIGITPVSSEVSGYELIQNYPNPFNTTTSIEFSLPKNSDVNLKVYDMQGRVVADLLNGVKLNGGRYKFDFNAGDYKLTSGVYFYRLTANDFVSTMKMLLIK